MEEARSYKPRKSHKKSRNGCKNCRRRKIKCDETKPECRTCVIREEQCEYFPHTLMHDPGFEHLTSSFTVDRPYYRPSGKSGSGSHSPPSMGTPARLNQSGVYHGPTSARFSDISHDDLYLFDHYLKHTCHFPGLTGNYDYARRIGVPEMAKASKGLLCSLLAFGAACLCVDTLLGYEPLAYIDHIEQLISKGDYYHGIGLAHMSSQLASTPLQNLEIAHAHSAVLFPYPAARKRIFRLLHRHQRKLGLELHEPEADSPSKIEWIHLLRGITTITRARMGKCSVSNSPGRGTEPPDAYIVSYLQQAIDAQNKRQIDAPQLEPELPTARRHALAPALTSTVVPALDKLYSKLEPLEQRLRVHHRKATVAVYSLEDAGEAQFTDLQAVGACWSALSILEAMCTSILQPPTSPSSAASTISSPEESSSSPSPLDTAAPWLQSYIAPPPTYNPSQPLTAGVLSWCTRVPTLFLTLLSEPLPQRCVGDEEGPLASQIRVLAWDVYAHWLACAILLEGEAWWIADLGSSDIAQIDQSLHLSAADWAGEEGWLPGRMRGAAADMADKGGAMGRHAVR